MIRSVFAILLLTLPTLAGCSDPLRPGEVRDDRDLAGGNSGTEGSLLPCEDLVTTLATAQTRSDSVGASTADLLELANRQPEVSLAWPALDSGPRLAASSNVLMLSVAAGSEPAREIACGDPTYPEKYRGKPRIEMPVVITLRTADGVLDERLDGVLSATSSDRAQIAAITLEPEALKGSLGATVGSFYRSGLRSLVFELNFGPRGVSGWIGGPFSPHRNAPCSYTAYARWPADAGCGEEQGGEPIDDQDSMTPHLARVNQTFDIGWQDGRMTKATFEAELADGMTCAQYELVSHLVRLRIVSSDDRIDLTMTARLSGGPQTIDPWPAHLRDVEPFTLELDGSSALDAAALADQLGYSEPNVSAAIVSVWLSSPSGIDSPVLSGGLRVAPIDRTGFDTALPTVELPGGDSARCFSSGGRTGANLSATITRD